ncbi:MAG: fibronectin type III domain-containing protein [Deltaproteobacteria bacterium]|nr:MAG: fibronectin type III domain-containing protein [Deltaproteobacteria bacterium]
MSRSEKVVHQKGVMIALIVAAFLAVAFGSPRYAHAQATITVVNLDGAGEGFNDSTPVPPVGGNTGSTLGAQRFNAFQFAADIWGNIVDSSVEISIGANFDPLLPCSSTSGILGQAGSVYWIRDFPGALEENTWYPAALANSLAGTDLDPTNHDIGATFNSDIGKQDCLPNGWYYGLDGNPPPGELDFVSVVLHELGHGLGFQTVVDLVSGAKANGFDDIYMLNLEDHSTGKFYPEMTDAERVTASTNTGDLHWAGANVIAESGGLTAGRDPSGHVEMYAPNPQEPGSSVSHFSITLSPDELMEPFFTGANHDVGLAEALMQDIGWFSILGITPTVVDLPTGDSISLAAAGGSQPYSWSIVADDGTKGTLSSTTGEQTTYTAPNEVPASPVAIQVDDNGGQTVTATVNVYEASTPPTITTGSASSVGSSSATLNGTVKPNGSSTSYYFEYGTTATYGSVTPTTDAGSGASDVPVSADISGLDPETTYHFRIVATNSFGTSYGSDQTFDTLPITYDLSVNIEGSGSVVLNPSGGTYNAGTVVTLTASGVGDGVFTGWSGALTGVDNPKTITMDSDKNVTAKFIEVVEGDPDSTIKSISAVDPDDIAETADRPTDFPYGMIEMTIEVTVVGDTAVVTVIFPNPAPADYDWYKYSATEGWIPFGRDEISGGVGDGAEFNPARTQVTLYITDNGPYDDDPTDGFIRDPSGLGKTPVSNPPAAASGGGGGGGCFIATAAFGSPLIGFSWMSLRLGLVPTVGLGILMLSMVVACITVLHRKLTQT